MADPKEEKKLSLEDVEHRDLHHETADEYRIILVGKTGHGKSSTGNRLLGRDDVIASLDNMNGDMTGGGDETLRPFTVSPLPNSCTPKCHSRTVDVCHLDKNLMVVDTPGFFSTLDPLDVIMKEVTVSLSLSAPGPHIVLLVVRLDVKFGKEEEDEVTKKVMESLGDGVERHLIVVFTFGHILQGQPVEKLLAVSPALKNLVQTAGGRYVVLTNIQEKREAETQELMEKMKALLTEKGNKYFTNATFKAVSEEINKEVTKIKDENPQLSDANAIKKVRENIVQKESNFFLKLAGIVVASTVFGTLVGVSGGAALGATPLIVAGVAPATAAGAAIGAAGTATISSLAALVAAVKRRLSTTQTPSEEKQMCDSINQTQS